jgi:trimethylamine:corrinoid methyltransferase-like protein
MKPGIRSWNVNVLSATAAERVHHGALSLLLDPGIVSESDLLLDVCRRGGAHVDRDARVIRLPGELVEWALKAAPRSFTVHGRNDPDNDIQLEPGRVYYGLGGTSEPYIWDYDLLKPRSPTKADMVNGACLGHALPNIDVVQSLCMSGDITPTNVIFYHDYDAILRNTSKPTVLSLLERPFTRHCLALAAAASGGEDELRRHARVGFEDNPYYRPGEPATSNAQLVERVVRIAYEVGRRVLGPDEARAMLGLGSNTSDDTAAMGSPV